MQYALSSAVSVSEPRFGNCPAHGSDQRPVILKTGRCSHLLRYVHVGMSHPPTLPAGPITRFSVRDNLTGPRSQALHPLPRSFRLVLLYSYGVAGPGSSSHLHPGPSCLFGKQAGPGRCLGPLAEFISLQTVGDASPFPTRIREGRRSPSSAFNATRLGSHYMS